MTAKKGMESTDGPQETSTKAITRRTRGKAMVRCSGWMGQSTKVPGRMEFSTDMGK